MAETAIDRIKKRFGEDATFKLNSRPLNIPAIPTGSIALDRAIGIGGIPCGRITEIFGPESSGKSTVAQYVIANAQKLGKQAAYVDMEHALDPYYAKHGCGVDIDNLDIAQPGSGEEALEIAEEFIRDSYGVVVIDSIAALVPRAEIEGNMGDSHMGLQARLLSQACRKLNPFISQNGTAVIFTNQMRQKIGVMYGDPSTTPGGLAMRFYASVRIKLSAAKVKDGQEIVANDVTANVIKNKVAPPFGKAKFVTKFGTGIDHFMELVEMGAQLGLITRRGAFFSYNEDKLGQGAQNARNMLEQNPGLAAEIEAKIRTSDAPIEIEATTEEQA